MSLKKVSRGASFLVVGSVLVFALTCGSGFFGDSGSSPPSAGNPPSQELAIPIHADREVELATSSEREAAPQPSNRNQADGIMHASDLMGLHEKNLTAINRVLKKSGSPTIPGNAVMTIEDLEMMVGMVAECDRAINDAADAVLDFQRVHAESMTAKIIAASERGEAPPFDVLPNGVLPNRGPYDLIITSSQHGVVYGMKVPIDQPLMEIVDSQRTAEALRVDAYRSFAGRLK